MPTAVVSNNRKINDFFKPFVIPKQRRPANDTIEEEIVVASPQRSPTAKDAERRASLQRPISPPRLHRIEKPSLGRPRKHGTPTKSKSRSQSVKSASATPKRSPAKRAFQHTLDGAADDSGLSSVSSSQLTPSKRRVMVSVDIPSPKPKSLQSSASSLSPSKSAGPNSPAKPTEQAKRVDSATSIGPPRAANTSFTSTAPPASQASSSRRIIKNGLGAVTNSDSGSADSSDEGGLADIDSFMPRKKPRLTPPAKTATVEIPSSTSIPTVKATRQSTRLSDHSKSSERQLSKSWRPASPPPTKYKHSLADLVKQRQKQAKADEMIAEAEKYVQDASKAREEADALEDGVDGMAMAANMADDSDEKERMMQAMERTEALERDEQFYFFATVNEPPMSGRMPGSKPFPDGCLPDRRWAKLLKDDRKRRQACTAGFVAKIAADEELPVPVLQWMADQLFHEHDEALCEAYVHITETAVAAHKATYGASERLNNLASRHSALARDCRDMRQLYPHRGSRPAALPRGIKYSIETMTHLNIAAGGFSAAQEVFALSLLNVDENVRQDANLQAVIADSICHLADASASGDVDERMFLYLQTCFWGDNGCVTSRAISQQLLCRIIAALPANTTASCELRRQLALRLIIDTKIDEAPKASPDWTKAILKCLKTAPAFSISETTNYALLNSLIEVLDFAIGAGFSDFEFHGPACTVQPSETPSGIFATKQTRMPPEEAAFNAQIDALASQLRLMSSSIRDAGTSHLKRTEAKSAIERLVVRLEFSVRTKPRPRKNIFGGRFGGESKKMLNGFAKKEVNVIDENTIAGAEDINDRPEKDEVEVVPPCMLSDREGD